MLTVRFHTEDATRALDQLGARGKSALRRSLRRTAGSVRTVMASAVAKDSHLRVGTVRDEVRLRIDEEQTVATISVSGRRIPLIEFRASGPYPSRGRGRGVSALVQGQRKRYPGAFIAQMRSGHRGVFMRIGPSTRTSAGGWSRNLPIVELHGPSLPHVFAKYIPLGIARAEEQLVKNLEHELQFAFSQE